MRMSQGAYEYGTMDFCTIELGEALDFMRFVFVGWDAKTQTPKLESGGLARPILISLIRDDYDSISTAFLSAVGSPPRAYGILNDTSLFVYRSNFTKMYYVHTHIDVAPLTIDGESIGLYDAPPYKFKALNFIAYPDNSIEPLDPYEYPHPKIVDLCKDNCSFDLPRRLINDKWLKIKEIKSIKQFKKCIGFIQALRKNNK